MEIIGAVDRALDILLLIYHSQEPLGISEISKRLDLAKSSVHRTLYTLMNKGFVYQEEDTEKYFLGVTLYGMGLLLQDHFDISRLLEPYADELSQKVGEVVNISILKEDEGEFYQSVLVYKAEPDNNVLSVSTKLGSSQEAHLSSVGKCLLAFEDQENLDLFKDQKLSRATDHTVTDLEELKLELEDIREKKYAIDREEREIGLYCIGAPILDKKKKALAAISISGPYSRMKHKGDDFYIKNLKKTVKKIEDKL